MITRPMGYVLDMAIDRSLSETSNNETSNLLDHTTCRRSQSSHRHSQIHPIMLIIPSRRISSVLSRRIVYNSYNHINNCNTSLHHHRTMTTISTIQRIGTDDPRMSRAIIHNGIVYISGQTDAATADNIKGQTLNTLKKVDDLLKQAGTSKSNLLTASIWLKDIKRDFKDMNEVWNGWLDPNNKPVRATVEANLARDVLLVEVQVTAAATSTPIKQI